MMAMMLLVACGDKYDPEFFRDKDVVEMSNEEVATMLSQVDWETTGEAMMFAINADVNFESESSVISDFYTNQSDMALDVTFNTASYFLDSDTVDEVRVHSQSDAEFSYTLDETSSFGGVPTNTSIDMSGSGSLGVYLYEGHLYVNPDATVTNDGTDVTISGKEKTNETLTQAMWDTYRTEADLEGIGEIADMPTELLDLFAWESVEDILAEFPAVTVYERRNVTDVHIEINKPLITDHLEDLLWVIYNMQADAGVDVPSVAQITQDIAETVSTANEYMDYFTELSFIVDIMIEDNKMVNIAVNASVLSNDDFTTDTGASIDLALTVTLSTNADIPSFPNDLDDYVGVDDIGSSYTDLFPFGLPSID